MNGPIDLAHGAVQAFEPEPGQVYTVEAAAYLAGVSRRTLLLYCRSGVVRPQVDPRYGALLFDDTSIHAVRRAELLRTEQGLTLAGVSLIFELLRELEGLREELRFLREA